MNIYKQYRFPSEIISYAVWLYHRFNESLREVAFAMWNRAVA